MSDTRPQNQESVQQPIFQRPIFVVLAGVVVLAAALFWVYVSTFLDLICTYENTPECGDAKLIQLDVMYALSIIGALCLVAATCCLYVKRRARPWALGFGACLAFWLIGLMVALDAG